MNNQNPITKVYLLSVPLENDYKNTLYFANASAQQTYFQSRIVTSYNYSDFTYQRKDQIIRIPTIYDNIYHCNYVMYQNSNYSNKWFYAFITKMEYINDGRTDVHIETDVIQTWLFDYTLKASFVEREHTNNDTIGNNTVPEGLETGEYIINSHLLDAQNNNLTCVVGSTVSPGEFVNFYGGIYNNIPSGISYYRFDSIRGETNSLQSFLNNLATEGKSDAVTGIFLAPKWLAGGNSSNIPIANNTDVATFDLGISKLTTLNGYSPSNNKLLTYPYVYINMTNGQGANAIYHQELWSVNGSNEMVFRVKGCLTPGCSIRGIPVNYKNDPNPYDEGINLGKFPQINWTTDQFTNWLTQNGVSIGGITLNAEQKGIVGGGLSALLGAGMLASGNPVGAMQVGSGLGEIFGTMQEVYRHSLMPPQAEGNLNSGDVTTASDNNRFHCYKMSIRSEWASRIDKYFDMFGYKTNMVKVPNSNHRSKWWYTKTIDVNIDGNIDNNDMQKIKDCYNRGITFWRNASEIQNYSLSNPII